MYVRLGGEHTHIGGYCIFGYWSILVDTGGCFPSPTYLQPCRPRWRRRSCCKPDIEGRRGERSNPSWEFWKKMFWLHFMILMFLFSLYLWTNALFHITTTFDPFGSLPRTDYMFVFSKDQRLRYTKENMAMNVLEGYETSEIFCFWCSSWRVSAGMNECRLLRHLNSFKCCWFNIFYQTHTSVRWLKGTKNYQQVSLNSFIQFLFTGWWKGEHYHEINRTMVSLPSCLNLECYIL